MKKSFLYSCVILLYVASVSAFPFLMDQQGILKNSSGNVLTGSYNFNFTLYNISNDAQMYTEAQDISITNGLWNYIIGEGTAIDPSIFEDGLYLKLKVNGSTFNSHNLTAVPYSFYSYKANDTNYLGGVLASNYLTNSTMNQSVHWDNIDGVPAGFSDGVDNTSTSSFTYSDYFDQDLNTTSSPKFANIYNKTEVHALNSSWNYTVDTDTTYSENDDYLTLTGTVFGTNETKLNSTIDARTAGTTHLPVSVQTVYGTVTAGDITSLQTILDGDNYTVQEASGVNPMLIYVNFTNVEDFDAGVTYIWYDGGSSHRIDICLFNINTANWDCSWDVQVSEGFNIVEGSVIGSTNYINTSDSDKVRMKFEHVGNGITSHYLYIDYVAITDGGNVLLSNQHDALSGRDDIITNHPNAASVFLNLSGGNANQNLDVGTYNFSATALFSDDWSNVTITESQISDLSHTVDTYNTTQEMRDAVNGTSLNIANTGTLDGYEGAALLDNTDAQTLSYSNGNITITGGNSVNISAVDTDTTYTATAAWMILTGTAFSWNESHLWTMVYNETEVDTLLAAQDECSEITGCVEGALTSVASVNMTTNFGGEVSGTYDAIVLSNTALDDQYFRSEANLTNLLDDNYAPIDSPTFTTLVNVPDAFNIGNKITHTGDTNTEIQVTDDQWNLVTGGSTRATVNNNGVAISNGNLDLNSNDIIDVDKISALDWTNVSITESQISDLGHTVDTYNTTAQMRDAVNETHMNFTGIHLTDDIILQNDEYVDNNVDGDVLIGDTGGAESYYLRIHTDNDATSTLQLDSNAGTIDFLKNLQLGESKNLGFSDEGADRYGYITMVNDDNLKFWTTAGDILLDENVDVTGNLNVNDKFNVTASTGNLDMSGNISIGGGGGGTITFNGTHTIID